jgi:glutathione S-transferase
VHTTYGHLVRPSRYADDAEVQEAIKAKARANYEDLMKEIDSLLTAKKWAIANQYTVVDGYLLVFYRWANRQKLPVRSLANYTAHAERVLARPAVKKVMADEAITLD